MGVAEFNACDHSELGMFLEGHRAREKREATLQLSHMVRASKMLAETILLGLDGKPYKNMRKDFPELFGGQAQKRQTWQEQEAILRRFLNMPPSPQKARRE